jgi:hydroxypyruvate reductase
LTPEDDPRRLLGHLLDRALAAVGGAAAVRRALQAGPIAGPVRVLAIGKAAQAMTEGACGVLGGEVRGGLVISKPGHLSPERSRACGLEALVGGHPVPTAGSLAAGARLLEEVRRRDDAVLLFLVSGGASSLAEVPAGGLGLAEIARMNRWLLASGLAIDAMNAVRTSVSRIKGGGLLRWLQGRGSRVLAISDVPGDDPAVIGSGLLVPDPGLEERVRALDLPDWLRNWVDRGLAERGDIPPRGPSVELAATLGVAMRAVRQAASGLGLAVRVEQTLVDGDAAARGRDLARSLMSGPAGVRVWGGETTVRLPEHPGRGGRNQHLALAAAMELAGRGDCFLLSAGTDGTDGPTEDAGALVDGGTLERAALEGLDAKRCLETADAGSLLAASGDLICTGPTGTNVMDLILGMKL